MEKVKKEETTTEVSVFNIETFKASQLPQLIGKREAQQKIIDDNPYVVIIDTATHESAKKSRTALKTARTSIANEKKMVVDRLKEVVIQSVSKEYDELSQMPAPFEDKQQAEIDRWDDIKKAEKAAKEKAEQDRIDGIKVKIEEFRTTWKTTISEMEFSDIETKTAEFDKAVTEYDKKPLEEFSVLFNRNVSDLELAFIDKTKALTAAENLRIYAEKLEQKKEIGDYYFKWGSKLNYMTFESSTETLKIFNEEPKLTLSFPKLQEDYDTKYKEIQTQLLAKQKTLATAKSDADKLAKDKADQDKITAENARKSKEIADAQAKLDLLQNTDSVKTNSNTKDIFPGLKEGKIFTGSTEATFFEKSDTSIVDGVSQEIKEVVVTENSVAVVMELTWWSVFEDFFSTRTLEKSERDAVQQFVDFAEQKYNVLTKK